MCIINTMQDADVPLQLKGAIVFSRARCVPLMIFKMKATTHCVESERREQKHQVKLKHGVISVGEMVNK